MTHNKTFDIAETRLEIEYWHEKGEFSPDYMTPPEPEEFWILKVEHKGNDITKLLEELGATDELENKLYEKIF